MTKKILVIEDEKISQALVKFGLKESRFEVVVADDGEIGLQKVAEEMPHLIILDIGLPNMDGYEFMTELKMIEGGRDVPVIVLTANETLEDVFRLEGIKEYMTKPINLSDLLARVTLYLGEDDK